MTERKAIKGKPDKEQPPEPWHQRHFPLLLAGGMLLLLVLVIVLSLLSEE